MLHIDIHLTGLAYGFFLFIFGTYSSIFTTDPLGMFWSRPESPSRPARIQERTRRMSTVKTHMSYKSSSAKVPQRL